jgi:ComF family protein
MIKASSRALAWLGHALPTLAGDVEAFLLPERCPGCGGEVRRGRLLCEPCEERVPRLEGPLCVRCLRQERDPSSCASHPGYRAWARWIYDERMSAVVHALKFGGRRGLAGALGTALAQSLPIHYRPDLVLEVPLHSVRLRERGYNQAALLADALALRLGSPRLPGALSRVRATPPQSGLSASARRRNLEGAFAVETPRALRNREVLVVDDVLTTGSTLEACLAALRDCGARATGAAIAWAQ